MKMQSSVRVQVDMKEIMAQHVSAPPPLNEEEIVAQHASAPPPSKEEVVKGIQHACKEL